MPSDFLFVNGPSSSAEDPGMKTLIRKQAMKQAAESRKRRGYRRNHNVRQYPVFRQDAAGSCAPTGVTWTALVRLEKPEQPRQYDEATIRAFFTGASGWNHLPPAMPLDNFHQMRSRFRLDPRNLCRLTSMEMGRAANEVLLRDPRKVLHLISPVSGSYMAEIPARYGNCRSLTSATDAVVALVRAILNDGQTSDAEASLVCYARALRFLQGALDSPETVMEANVLCATQMLSLYELLNFNRNNSSAWVQHTSGAAKLIRMRGPARFRTEFEKNLLVASAGPIVSESVLNNQACFLAEPEWIKAIPSLTMQCPTMVERHESAIKLMAIVCQVPGVLREFTLLMRTENPYSYLATSFLTLYDKAKLLLQALRVWHDTEFPVLVDSGVADRVEVLCVLSLYSTFTILLGRPLASLGRTVLPAAPDFETMCQEYARDILQNVRSLENDGFETILIAQKIQVAEATVATKDEWAAFHEQSPGPDRPVLIGRQAFDRWNNLFGRTTQ